MFAGKLLYYNFHELSNSFKLFVFFFLVISSTISTIFVYRNRPFTNPRCIQLTNCILKFTSLSLIYISVSDKDLFFMTIFGFFTLKISCKLLNLIKAAIFYNSKKSNRRFPLLSIIQLLTLNLMFWRSTWWSTWCPQIKPTPEQCLGSNVLYSWTLFELS